MLRITTLTPLARAGQWLRQSGIQTKDGGVARYRLTEEGRNLPVSTEITGYAASGYCFLYEETGEGEYLAAARQTGQFLLERAWDAERQAVPFELEGGAGYSYFFDCGIIARALLWLHRLTGEEAWAGRAVEIGDSMARHFRARQGFHPIVDLRTMEPVAHEIWWSRMPGAFQLKAALAWRELEEVTGERRYGALYEEQLEFSLAHYAATLDNEQTRLRKMDRLHAWAYFLEGLQAVADREPVRYLLKSALAHGEKLREELAPEFLRSDVCAQLLRVKLLGGGQAGPGELERIESFQYQSEDPTLDGGYGFGRRSGELTPHVNPVSTVFCVQALSYAQNPDERHADWRRLI